MTRPPEKRRKVSPTIKRIKVRKMSDLQPYGIGCRSLDECKNKGCAKLGVCKGIAISSDENEQKNVHGSTRNYFVHR